jgi:PKD repeat protein
VGDRLTPLRTATAVLAAVLAALACGSTQAAAATLPPGFSETVVTSGLTAPTAVRFAPDGRVFVTEKRGVIKEFSSLSDTTPRVVVDLRTKVMDYVDRGLLGLAIPPGFPGSDPSIYVSYSLDAAIGGTPPVYNDNCPNVMTTNCLTAARVSRVNVATGAETILVEDWCMQYPSHTIGALAFGSDGSLYASGGEGADYNAADWGQNGQPPNPCGDPPGAAGTALTRPSSEGGALRSQDVRTTADPTGLDGTIIRINPQTGAGWPGNPFASSPNANAKRIVAYGMRNPWRIAQRPGTDELWFSEVGWGTLEEINRVQVPNDAVAENFGWPCFEGTWRQPFYTGLDLCDSLMAAEMTPPFFNYFHDQPVVSGEDCPNSGASVSGLSFVPTTNQYPAAYQGALFFGDYSRSCIWVIQRSASSGALPDPANVKVFMEGASAPVDIQAGPGGYLYYVDLFGGTLRRIDYSSTKPVATFTATPSSGAVPLPVAFDASGSNDPDGTTLTYAWKFGDGTTGTGKTPAHTYQQPGRYTVELTVTDASGATGTTTRTVSAGVPVVTIATPSAATTWSVGQELSFSGSAVDSAGAAIPAANLTWTIVLEHGLCPECHEHAITSKVGASGDFDAPDHDLPSSILLRLTAVDGNGLVGTATRRLQPRTTQLTVASAPAGLSLNLDGATVSGPFAKTVIAGSAHSLDAAAIQSGLSFSAWSDGGARAHSITAPASNTTYTATYVNKPPVASFTVSDQTPDKGQPVTFNAAGSSDPEGTTLTYAWDLDGDGQYDDGTAATVNRTYTAGGPVTVRLRVKDARDGTDDAAVTLTVQNKPPTASITPADVSPLIQVPVSFTAGGSDPDGAITKREWDLDHDGQFDDATGATATWTFQTTGPKIVGLRVTDDDGATAEATTTVTAHRPPVAAFAYAPDPVERNVEVTFTSGSSDPENRLSTQTWDLDGDGQYDDATGPTAKRTFTTAAGNVVGLRVTDLDGGSDEKRVAIVPGNKRPVVSIAASPAAPATGVPVTFTATASDPDGAIESIAWDLDDGSAFDDGTGATAGRSFAIGGTYAIRVRVEDDDGASVDTTLDLGVANRAPVAAFGFGRPVRRGTPVTFTSASTDPEGRIAGLAWDLDGDGAYDDGAGATATRTFTTPTGNAVGLKVTDLEGGSDTERVVVVPDNLLPAISVAAFPADPFVDSPVTLRATATDRDGAIAGVAWDLDDGDAFDDGTGATITRAFAAPGLRQVRAQATDDAGAVAIAAAAIEVRDGEVPERLEPRPRVKVAATPTRKGAKVRRFSVKAPRGATVRVSCKGEGCPPAKQAEGAGAARRMRRFERSFRGGTKLVVRVTEDGLIGTYVKVRIRSRHREPARTDSCLWPGESAPRACSAD